MRRTISILALCVGFAVHGHAQSLNPDQFDTYSPDLDNGKVVFHASACAACHAVDGSDDLLAGGMEIKTRFGTLSAPNITAHPVAGIGTWSRADFVAAVQKGQAPDGSSYFGAVFPFPAYAQMRTEDVLDLHAYILTLPHSDAPSSRHKINLLDQFVLGLWSEERDAILPAPDPQLARGAYLVEAMGHCAECHSGRTGTFATKLDPEKSFAGETGMLGEYAGPINAAQLAQFTPESFVNGSMVNGLKLNGLPMTSTVMRRISRATGQLSHEDRVAMYAYLTGVPIAPDTVPEARSQNVEVVNKVAAAVPSSVVDRTGAVGLIGQIEAYCSAPDPAMIPASPAVESTVPAAGDPALEARADAVLEQHCRSCHGRGMTNQRSFFTGSIAELARDRGAVIPGDHRKSLLYDTIASNRMPTGRLPRVSEEELEILVRWIDGLAEPDTAGIVDAAAQTPVNQVALPRFVGGDFVSLSTAAVRDVSELSELDRSYIRYFSFANVPLPEIDCSKEGALRNPVHYMHTALNKFLNSVSRGPALAPVTPVEGSEGALVRIDLRDYGWSDDDWRAITLADYTSGGKAAGFEADIWAELAPRYPFALDPRSDSMLGVLAGYTQSQVPILNADWFARHASEAPLYDLLLRLPDHIGALEARMGIDVNREISNLRMIRAGFTAQHSGVSDHNRMLERFDLPLGGYYWKSYDFAGSDGRQSLILHPDGPQELASTPSGTEPFEHDGGEMIFSLANGLQGYYLSEANGRRLSEGPTSIVSFRERPVGQGVEIVNARSCFTCHDNGIISKRDQLRDYILSNTSFDRMQRETLLRMYPDQETLDGYYRRDTETFLRALEQLNATETTVAGRPTSLMAPDGSGEIVTWLADHRFKRLEEETVARHFHLTAEQLRSRAQNLGDPQLQQLVAEWFNRFDQGLSITFAELEDAYGPLLARLTPLRALDASAAVIANILQTPHSQDVEQAFAQVIGAQELAYTPPADLPAFRPADGPADPLHLRLHVPQQRVRVNELLSFEVEANRACSLQIVYVEMNHSVVVLPQSVLGPDLLQPGERRVIPQPDSGLQLRFDRPGSGETLLAYCREPGSSQSAMRAEELVSAARERFQPLTRGLAIEAASRVDADTGQSAFASVTIEVVP